MTFSTTIQPFLRHEYESASISHTLAHAIKDILPSASKLGRILHANENWSQAQYALWIYYTETDPVTSALVMAAIVAMAVWIIAIVNKNYSQMDRLWSVLPFAYSVHYSIHSYILNGSLSPRLMLMTSLQALWSVRLTFNYARKGGYLPGAEDYRHVAIRQYVPAWLFQIYNFLFLAIIQNVLLWSLSLPTYVVYAHARSFAPYQVLNGIDYASTVAFILCFILELVADEQQWDFQCRKAGVSSRWQLPLDICKKSSTIDIKDGFLRSGLFRYSRHPNFLAEMLLWWSLYGFSIAASYVWLNYSLNGAAALTLLFSGSTWLTELLAEKKYGRPYRAYQANVGRFLPNILGIKLPSSATTPTTTTPSPAKREKKVIDTRATSTRKSSRARKVSTRLNDL